MKGEFPQMTDDQKNDGMATLSERREMNSEPLGERSDKVSTTIEDKAHLPAAPQGGTGASRVAIEGLDGKMADAVQADEKFYDELDDYNAEREPETQSWKTTRDDDLPVDTSTTADRPSSDDA
jgi:hypothetical protein